MASISTLPSLVAVLLIFITSTGLAERQARYNLGDNTPVNYRLGNVAEQAGLTVPSGGFSRVLIDRLPALASKHFNIDKRGELTVAEALDRDQLCTQLICCYRPSCSISFRVFITTMRSREHVQVDVTLRDENDNGPQFSVNTVSLLENTPVGSSKPLPKATDSDSPANGVKSYRLTDDTGTFRLVMSGSDPMLRVERPLDRETQASYTLNYQAIDGGSPPRVGSMTLQVIIKDVNDNAPKFDKRESTVTVKEDLPDGSRVAHLKTTDRDEGENGQVTYRLTADSTPVGLANTLFSVGATSGVVTVAKPLDFEDNRQASGFVLYVVAADKGKPPRSSTATLRIRLEDVNDNAPVVKLDPSSAKVIEGEKPGKLVATVTVKDADEVSQGKVNCALTQGNGFRLVPLSSLLLDLFTVREFDHEVESSVDITLECRDEAEPRKTISQTFEITIIDKNDNAPQFIGGSRVRRIVLPEDWPTGREVIHLMATDADSAERKAIRYSLNDAGARYFSVHRDSGRVYLRRGLDRETDDRIEFSVIATDGGMPARSSQAKVVVTVTDVNDNAPRLMSPTSFTVVEGTPADTEVARLSFKDDDFGLNGTWLTQISPKANVANTMFRIMNDGRLLTKSVIDREMHPSLFLEVIAFDTGTPPQTTTVALTVTIADRNDNAPVLVTPNPGSIVGNSPPLYATAMWNTTVVRLRGRDPDNGVNGSFFFRILKTNATDLIGLEPQTGRIYTKWAEGKGRAGDFYLNIELRDRGNPPLRSTATLYLHIGESGPLDRMRGVAINNIVILALIIVCSVALAISLIVAIVWARSRINRSPHGSGDGRDPYGDYDLKVPDESLSEHNMDEDEHHPPLPGHRLDGTFKSAVTMTDEDYVDPYHHCSLSRKDIKSAPMQTFSASQPFRSVVFMPVVSPPNGILQRGPEQHRGPISPERMHLRRNSDASNEDSGKGGSDDNLSKCSVSNPPGSVPPRVFTYVRRPCHEGTMC